MDQRSTSPVAHVIVEPVTTPGTPPLPGPSPEEADQLLALAALGADVRVWR
jgi:hypothetical protein